MKSSLYFMPAAARSRSLDEPIPPKSKSFYGCKGFRLARGSFDKSTETSDDDAKDVSKIRASLLKDPLPSFERTSLQEELRAIPDSDGDSPEKDHLHSAVGSALEKDEVDKKFAKDSDAEEEEDMSKLPVCAGCAHPILANERVLKAEGHYFHEGHLVCYECSTPLGPTNRIFLKSGKAYCKTHAFNRRVCSAVGCGLLIDDEAVVLTPSVDSKTSTTRVFHKRCFRCQYQSCAKSLLDSEFVTWKDHPYCMKHGRKMNKCPVCKASNEDPTKKVLLSPLSGKICHVACIRCSFCRSFLNPDDPMLMPKFKNDKFFCSGCFDMLAPQCTRCGIKIEDGMFVADNGETYHQHCFSCTICGELLDQYKSVLGELRCRLHKRIPLRESHKCQACNKEITGLPLAFAGKMFHRSCFKCIECSKSVTMTEGSTRGILVEGTVRCFKCTYGEFSEGLFTKVWGMFGAPRIRKFERVSSIDKDLNALAMTDEKLESIEEKSPDVASTRTNSLVEFDAPSPPSMSVIEEKSEADSSCLDEFEEYEKIRFDKGKKIGEGSYGRVYVCRRIPDNSLMAVKEIDLPSIAAGSLKDCDGKTELELRKCRLKHYKELHSEVKILRRLDHPNIVKYLGIDINEEHNVFRILMEFVPGNSMAEHLKLWGKYSEDTIRGVARRILSGLAYLHSRKIVHRDLKSGNILISDKGVPKLADFGSAKLLTHGAIDQSLIASGKHLGTPLFVPPEMVIRNVYTRKSDIWSFGCVLIEMASAKLPWSECAFTSPFAAMWHIAQEGNLPKIPEDLSDVCKDFISKCLTRDPKLRWDATQLLEHPFLSAEKDS